MNWSYFWAILKIFFGVCLILLSIAVLLYDLFLTPNGFEAGLAFVDLFIFLSGLFLTVFNAAKLSAGKQDEEEYE